MQNFRNYYEILDIPKTATEDEIKQSFRRLARQCHPDLNPGNKAAEEQFKVIGEAYEILSDPDRRARYDQFSQYWKQKGFQSNPSRRSNSSSNSGWSSRPTGLGNDVDYSQFPDFNTFVEELLGKQPRSGFSRTTVTRRVVRSSSPPPDARRSGRSSSPASRPAAPPRPTPPPAASMLTEPSPLQKYRPGITKTVYTVPPRSIRRDSVRRDVEAKLVVPLEKAYQGGIERVRLEDDRTIEVEMPGGLVTGQKVRLRGQGLGGGDLYLCIEVMPHKFFRLQGIDIYCVLPITAIEATLGVPVDVPTLDGLVQMNIPAGIRSGQRLRLAAKGYPTADGERGDQIVELEVLIPPSLSSEERSLYQKLYGIESFKPRRILND
ncbi:MAG: DnaJ C-terminal domain-containing protein [Prochlorotrichaceae cyanobacterium]